MKQPEKFIIVIASEAKQSRKTGHCEEFAMKQPEKFIAWLLCQQ
jgi:hypothetical protein